MPKSSTSFKPGTSGNPAGRPSLKIDPVRWEEIRADKQSLKDLIRAYLKLTALQMTERMAQPDCTNAEGIVAELILRAKGDHNTAKVVMEYAFGQMDDGPELMSLSPTEQEMINEYRRRTANPGIESDEPPSG